MIIVPVEKKLDWKRPPIVLILLVMINVFVFAFYQSGDNKLRSEAAEIYEVRGLLKKEWAAFKAYAERQDLPFELDRPDPDLNWYIVSDPGFDRFMLKNHRHYINGAEYKRWRRDRDRVEDASSQISTTAYGFNSTDISLVRLFSSQFLHAGVMHILGNMVFLILTGFAVEAALGSLRFLCFYLLSGVGAGLLFALFDPSAMSLVGASGSISGVMAMYVVLFGTRKIQFFYWLFIFTGYIRAAAIIMLPFYVGYEIYNYLSNDGSNVAYTAHIGGFLVGAALVFLTQSLNKTAIDEEYIEGEQEPTDPFAQSLTKLYGLVGQCEFKRAWDMLKPLKAKYPDRAILIEIEYNLVRALHPKKLGDYILHRMDKPGNNKSLILAQANAWQGYQKEQRQQLSFAKKSVLLQNALNVDALPVAENIFEELKSDFERSLDVAMLAKRLAVYCQELHQGDKTSKYNALAAQLAQSNVNSIGVNPGGVS